MKINIRIDVSFANQRTLMEELNARFPEGILKTRKGAVTAFSIEGEKSAPNIQEIIKYIENKGYTLTKDNAKDYSKHVTARETILYDKSDFMDAEYLKIDCKKSDGIRSGDGDIVDGRAQIEFPPPKFRYCLSQWVFLISPAVKHKLERETFIGPIFLPVDHLVGKKEKTPIPLDNLFALYSSIKLPPPAGWNEFGQETYDRSKLIPFDLAIRFEPMGWRMNAHRMICSQKFYRFWEANFGDAEYRPVRVRDDESAPLKTPYQGESGS